MPMLPELLLDPLEREAEDATSSGSRVNRTRDGLEEPPDAFDCR